MPPRSAPALLPAVPLLITESAADFGRIRQALRRDIVPDGIIEDILVDDITYFSWEIFRLRRGKVALLNTAYRSALENLYRQFLGERDADEAEVFDVDATAARFARNWFTDPQLQQQLARVLREVQLDDSAIAAEALRIAGPDVAVLDRQLASLEARRHKMLRLLYEYRAEYAELLRARSDRLIDGDIVALAPTGDAPSPGG